MNRLCFILLHNYYFYALFFIVCFLNRLFGCSIITSIVTIRDLHRLSNPCSCLLDSTLWTSCLFVSSVFQSPERCTHNNGIRHYFCDDRVIYYIKAWTHRLVLLSTLNVVNKRRIRTPGTFIEGINLENSLSLLYWTSPSCWRLMNWSSMDTLLNMKLFKQHSLVYDSWHNNRQSAWLRKILIQLQA